MGEGVRTMLIKDLETGIVREYGKDCHDSLAISPDGRSLSYYNLQCGEGSRYGCFRFVMEDGKVPDDSKTPDAIHAQCYFNIGGFPNVKQIRAEVIDEIRSKMVSFYTDAIFRYGVDIIEGRADAFNDLEKWLKEQNNDSRKI